MAAEDFDLTDDTDDGIDTGGSLGEGYYVVECVDQWEDENSPGNQKFKFKVTEGPCKDLTQFFTLFHPDGSDTDDKRHKAILRRKGIAKRLGLIKDGDGGKQVSVEWTDAIGWKGFIKTRRGQNGYLDLDYMGIWPFGHHDLEKIAEQRGFPEALKHYVRADNNEGTATADKKKTNAKRAPAVANSGANGRRADIPLDDI